MNLAITPYSTAKTQSGKLKNACKVTACRKLNNGKQLKTQLKASA
jgi:hypothetical protein